MVLRFQCPCGAPYALADHLAGRTFTCTSCGTALQIGTPAGAPPPPPQPAQPAQPPPGAAVRKSGQMKAPGADLGANLEWGAKKTSGGLKALDPDEKAPPKAPPKDAPLGLADDEEEDAEDEDEEADDEEGVWNSLEEDGPAPKSSPKGKRSPSSAGGRASGTGKALRTSGAGKAPAGGSARQKKQLSSARQPALPAAESVSMRCPVCEAEIARSAPSCPACGVRLKAPGFADKMAAGAWKGPVKAVVMLIAAGVIGTVIYKVALGDKPPPPRPPRPIDPPTEVAATEAPPTEAPATEPATESGSTETSTETATEAGSTEAGSTEASTERRRPPRPAGGEGPAGASADIVIPPGPFEADLKRLRDAKDGAPTREAITALAAKPGAAEAIAATREKSHDKVWHVRLHRVRLAMGDGEARRKVIEASLASEADGALPLLYTAAAATDLDPTGLKPALDALSLASPAQILARAWVDAALDGSAPRGGTVEALRNAWSQADGDTRQLLGPLLALAGDGGGLEGACAALEHDSSKVRDLAAKGLAAASGGSGPGGSDPAAWREWLERYRPLRDLVVRACGPLDEAGAAARLAVARRMSEIAPLLATIVRDRAVLSPEGGQALGETIALGARPSDGPALARMLAALEPEWVSNGGAHLLRGALLAADEAVAEAAATALVRGAARAEDLGPMCPDLIKPSARAIEVLSPWADGKGDDDARQAARLVQASFRTPALDSWVQGDAPATLRDPVGARLGSTRLEQQLFKSITGGHESAEHATDVLIAVGGEAAAEQVTKLLLEAGDDRAARAFDRLGDARQAKKVRRLIESSQADWVHQLMISYARFAGPEDAGALAKRLGSSDTRATIAREVLLKVRSREARDLIKPQVEALDPAGTVGLDIELAVTFAASAGPEDGALLKKLLRTADRYGSYDQQARLFMAAGRSGVPEAGADLAGYVQPGVPRRGMLAVALAMLGSKDLVPRARAVLDGLGETIELEDLIVAAALAVASPDVAKERLPKLVPAAIQLGEDGILALSMGLASLGLNAELTQLARSGKEQAKQAVSRGIAWMASGRPSPLPKLELLQELLFDADPLVRAEAAKALALQGDELGARACMSALHGGPELDELRRGDHRVFLGLARLDDTTTARTELWSALDRAMPGEAPPLRHDFPPGRVRDRLRTARAQLLGGK